MSEVQGHLLSVEDVGRELGLSVPQVWSLAASGELRSVHGSWPPKFRRVDVESHASPGRRVRRSGPESPRKYVTLPAGRQSSSVPGAVVPEVLSVEEAAALLGVSPTSLRQYVRNGDLATVGSPPRVSRHDLNAFVERCRITPGQLTHLDPNVRRRSGAQEPPLTQSGRPDRRYGRR
ncbi:MAG: Helix-turn-helix domain [Acidimicrobiaceae bacterium]|nr:Helix-turn-helix domain [Acidimicrobiaceae bacterium]